MAFYLYHNRTWSMYDYEEDTEKQLEECKNYTAKDLFCYEYIK